MNAYELNFSNASQVSKILAYYSKLHSEFMISFLRSSVMLTPGLESGMYIKVMVEIPYENMIDIGYINPEAKLQGKTLRIRSTKSAVSSTLSGGTIRLWADMDDYPVLMNVEHIKDLVMSDQINVMQTVSGIIQNPFHAKESHPITTIPNRWLIEVFKSINAKTKWQFTCSDSSISFVMADKTETYPQGMDRQQDENIPQIVQKEVMMILKTSISMNKDGITKVRLMESECWFIVMLGDWGQCMIRMGDWHELVHKDT
jgi:hypothetical protein